MSLLEESFEPFVMMDKTSEPDGYGGKITVWKEGAEIQATAAFDTSIQARIGGLQGLTEVYAIYTTRHVTLEWHDVVKRVSDGKIFRVTSDGDDKKTPRSAGLDLRMVTAEEWTLTS